MTFIELIISKVMSEVYERRKNWTRKLASGTLKFFYYAKHPFEFAKLKADDLDFSTREGNYALVWLNDGTNQVIAGRIKGIDKSIIKEGALIITPYPKGLDIKIPLSNISCYRDDMTSESQLRKTIEEGINLGFLREGSLHFTYLGMVYATTETFMSMLEMDEFRFLWETLGESFFKIKIGSADHLQMRPYKPEVLQEFLIRIVYFLINLPTTTKDDVIVIALTRLFTNMLSALVFASISDPDMRKEFDRYRNPR